MKHTARAQNGQSVVEFALVLPLSLLVILGIVVFGIAFARMEAVENGAAEGGRAAQRWAPDPNGLACTTSVTNAVERTTPFSVTRGYFNAANECSAPPGPVTDTLVCVSAVCPADPPDTSPRVPSGELITVHVVHEYVPVFFGTLFRDMWAPPNSFELHSEVTVMHE